MTVLLHLVPLPLPLLLLPLSQSWLDETVLVTGWHDRFIRAYDTLTGQKAWQIPNAHRGEGKEEQ